jgi:glycosyltransferase involved in cell wall biosynthesis
VRRGTKLGVYAQGVLHLLRHAFGHIDVVVDVQNGLPFFTRLGTGRPVVVLVHHVHREQWPIVYPGLFGRFGWWIESRVSPRLYRRSQYIAVSRATRDELVTLGVGADRVAVIHNGTETAPSTTVPRSPHPTVCVVGRLVPHKQVEHAVDAVRALRTEIPDIRLVVVGGGWWEDDLLKYVADTGTADIVTFTGQVSEQRKNGIYAEAWLMLLPSLKEGWGLVVGEAGAHGVPTVAYASAGGTRESIRHGVSGLLVADQRELTDAVRGLLTDDAVRGELGEGARAMSRQFTWEHSQGSFAQVVGDVLAGHRVSVEDPDDQTG